MKQRINSRQYIRWCKKCGDFCVIADGKRALCPACNPKKQRIYATAKWQTLRKIVLEKFKRICQICSEPGDCVDHIYPLSRGGQTVEENLTVLCKPCNSKKFFKTPLEFIKGKKTSYSTLPD